MTTPQLALVALRARKARGATAARDEAIRAAREASHSLREIASAAGLSHTQVANICRGQGATTASRAQ